MFPDWLSLDLWFGDPLLMFAIQIYAKEEQTLIVFSGIERLLRDGKAAWVMGPSNEVLRQFVGSSILFGLDALDYWCV